MTTLLFDVIEIGKSDRQSFKLPIWNSASHCNWFVWNYNCFRGMANIFACEAIISELFLAYNMNAAEQTYT